jgi:hypothetical protein
LKWKRKDGCLRCGEGNAQARIQEREGRFWLSWRLPGGAWEVGQAFDSTEDAKAAGERVLKAIDEFERQEKDYFQKRRDYYTERQKKKDSLTPEEKSLRAAFDAYVKLNPEERDYARKMAPRVIGIFDKVLAEEQQEGQASNA